MINRRARACPREGGSRITVHGYFLGASNITVGGQPCRDAVHDPSKPEELLTCVLPCPAGDRDEWIPDAIKQANVDDGHRSSSGWLAACLYPGVKDGIVGGHKYSEIDGKAQNNDPIAGWCGTSATSTSQYLELDLGTVKLVAGVVTQGRFDTAQWVKSMKVETALSDGVFSLARPYCSGGRS